ncbi:MAG: glutaredoxin 3 [Gammaproteobacteria bacterium]|nr:glutaredoxin 3 [Gammaproteobacteria bacterium]
MSNSAVTIYTGNRCAYCNAAKRLLDSKEVKYTEINVDDDPALREEMMTRTKRQSVPQILIGDLHVGGFDDLAELNHDGKLDKLLSS